MVGETERHDHGSGNDGGLIDKKQIGLGADSRVYVIKDIERPLPVTLKEYSGLRENHPFLSSERIIDVLRCYAEDTHRAAELLESDPNPLKEKVFFKINNRKSEEWSLSYVAVLQGDTIKENNDGVICVEGQDYITGESPEATYRSIYDVLSKEKDIFEVSGLMFRVNGMHLVKLSKYLNEKLKTNFDILPTNVKPRIDHQNKVVCMYITDLAADLYESYKARLVPKEYLDET